MLWPLAFEPRCDHCRCLDELPMNQISPSLTSPTGLASSSSRRPACVLVVDDDAFQRRLVKAIVTTRFPVTMIEACDGQQALTLLEQTDTPVDLVLCDLDMPVMDGMAFVRHLGRVAPETRLALISGSDTTLLHSVETMCRAYGIEPVAALKKPLNASVLEPLVDTITRHPDRVEAARPTSNRSVEVDEAIGALERDEYEAFFHPKACARSGRIVGAEALVRWRHPELGVLSPYPHFLDQLENAGHAGPLTEIVVRDAIQACRQWHDRGHPLAVSINLSLGLLQADIELADRISDIAQQAGVCSSKIMLEVTETAAATDIGPALENLARLRLRGFGLSIDDFGTGYSSLEQLRRVAFTELKIDRGFISVLEDSAEARAIVSSSLELARKLNLQTVAEGVEREAQWSLLESMGCDQMQGYYLGRPMSAAEFGELIQSRA